MTELNYEPRVILEHANRLNRRADSMGVTSAIIGGVIGGFFGAVPLTSLGDSWPIPHPFGFGTLLAGILVGALTGYVIGDARAFGYRLQAQSSLCQLHLERNTAALLSDTYSAAAAAAPPPPQPAPAPVSEYVEPEPEPAPVDEMQAPEYFTHEAESPSFVSARIAAYLEPALDPEPESPTQFETPAALVPEDVEPAPAPEPALQPAPEPVFEPVFEPAPDPAPFVEGPTLVPAGLDPVPADLNSLSLEEIAQLAKTGQI